MRLFNIMLVLSAALGLIIPNPGMMLKDYILVPLAISVFFSLLASRQEFRLNTKSIKQGIISSYLILTPALVVFALFMPFGIKEGIIMYAIYPPAIATVSLSAQWGGKPEDVFVFQLITYLASLVFIPLAALLLIGHSVDPFTLLIYLVGTFILPVVGSFVCKQKNKEFMNKLAEVFLIIVFYISIAKSQLWIIANWQTMLLYSIPLCIFSIAVGYFAYLLFKDPDSVLYATLKNGGAALAASTAILPESSATIISIKVIIDVILILVFGRIFEKKKKIK